jgi:DNA-directed RNA polymerase subunit RPC12/RpoP
MTEQIDCPECGSEIESDDDIDTDSIQEMDASDNSVTLYGNRDLYRCKNCKKPLGVGRSTK